MLTLQHTKYLFAERSPMRSSRTREGDSDGLGQRVNRVGVKQTD